METYKKVRKTLIDLDRFILRNNNSKNWFMDANALYEFYEEPKHNGYGWYRNIEYKNKRR